MTLDFSQHRFWLFDLDNTLYPPEVNLFGQISPKMSAYIAQHLGVSLDEASLLRDRYWKTYGATLAGLRLHHPQIDLDDFLACCHAIDVSHIPPAPELAAQIAKLPGQKYIFTNSTRPYAEAVLKARQMDGLFDGIYGLTETHYIPKPDPSAFTHIIAQTSLDPKACVMFEDDPLNLVPAKSLGMGTVLIGTTPAAHIDHCTLDLTDFLTKVLQK